MVTMAQQPTTAAPSPPGSLEKLWPALPLGAWRDTHATLHMWLQIVGKVRTALVPLVNHWWNSTLYVSARGLTTAAMPYQDRQLQIDFDFVDHNLTLSSSDGQRKVMPLLPRSVADFYREFRAALDAMDVHVKISPMPVEIPSPIRFDQDTQHASYDPQYAQRFWRILCQSHDVFQLFRGQFLGKCSPVHFFWGSCDLAVTRFNGRRAPARPGADRATQEAYSHECISHGFWPGGAWFGNEISTPMYYSYTAPEPSGLREQPVRPRTARFDPQLSEFVLPYDDVRQAPSPRQALSEFLQSTYEAGANAANWDRPNLERS